MQHLVLIPISETKRFKHQTVLFKLKALIGEANDDIDDKRHENTHKNMILNVYNLWKLTGRGMNGILIILFIIS